MSHSTGIHINGKAAIANHCDAIVVGVFVTDDAAMVTSACRIHRSFIWHSQQGLPDML